MGVAHRPLSATAALTTTFLAAASCFPPACCAFGVPPKACTRVFSGGKILRSRFRDVDDGEAALLTKAVGAEPLFFTRRDALAIISGVVTTKSAACEAAASGIAPQPKAKASARADTNVDPSLSAAAQRLWNLDYNRLKPGTDYVINVQGGKNPYQKEDVAPRPLFQIVDPRVFTRPTYRTFVALLNNYSPETCTPEDASTAERAEDYEFLRSVMPTPVMQFCYQYCRSRNPDRVPDSEDDFVKLLYNIWFKLYRRCEGEADSSGFEHVFVGETKDGNKVIGLHNWIQIYLQEMKGDLNYRGYIKPKGSKDGSNDSALPDGDDHVLTLQFTWNGAEKMVGTSFIGVSPEFELALFTMMFLVGKEDNIISLDTGTDRFDLDIKCFKIAKGKVGSCYVESLAHRQE